jgi:hypothetical protein
VVTISLVPIPFPWLYIVLEQLLIQPFPPYFIIYPLFKSLIPKEIPHDFVLSTLTTKLDLLTILIFPISPEFPLLDAILVILYLFS